ncbi:DUF6385 domain-containing protein [Alistipes sp.]|uniref:DUF6385 domain-containing protein n=1 Tax=Alistipes sp. TaxID=1872444 RepID=UPI003A844513
MRLFNASHLEVKDDFDKDFQTNPYECGWASECIFFVTVERLSGRSPRLVGEVEISPDGINWVKEGTVSDPITSEGVHFIRVKHFGNWLRLNCRIDGEEAVFRLNIQIALKE